MYENNYFASNETKVRLFQSRLNLRSIVTRVQLHGYEIVENNLCKFCYKKLETLMHLFCKCETVILLWNIVSDWILSRLRINIVLH